MGDELQALAKDIDTATEDQSLATLKLLAGECEVRLGNGEDSSTPIYLFLCANCYAAIYRFSAKDEEDTWSWKQSDLVTELLFLRKALCHSSFPDLDLSIQCKILTNTAGALSQFGRPIEAIAYWDMALAKLPNFAMALGNKGVGLANYGRSLYDPGHTAVLSFYAATTLNDALSEYAFWDSGEHPEVESYFADYYDDAVNFLEAIGYDLDADLDKWSLGETEAEVGYRAWCLMRGLFLSPLNDACTYSVAARDVLHLPSHAYKIEENPRFVAYFNVLKQEYATARHLMFEGIESDDDHYSDKEVMLLHVGDGAQYSFRNEQLKAAYRLMYSLLDKVALFINDYFSVGLDPKAVNFRSVWGKNGKKGVFEISEAFVGSKNWPLRGLFYLSKDLFEKEFKDVSSPDASELAKLRNNSEHRFVSLRLVPTSTESTEEHTYIQIESLEEKTMRVARMARESLIYLSLAMHREEGIRDESAEELRGAVQSVPIER